MEDTLIFVDDGFFGLVKKHFQKRGGKPKKYLQVFRNVCKKENVKNPAIKGLGVLGFLSTSKILCAFSRAKPQECSSLAFLMAIRNGTFLKARRVRTQNFLSLNLKHLFIYSAPPYQSPKPTKQENFLTSRYNNMMKMLKKKKWITVREGRCQRIVNEKGEYNYFQKGVDALIILDMYDIKDSYQDIKKIILIASDSDFAPVIDRMKQKGIEIMLYTYFDRIRDSRFSTSNHLLNVASKWVKLDETFFEDSPKQI